MKTLNYSDIENTYQRAQKGTCAPDLAIAAGSVLNEINKTNFFIPDINYYVTKKGIFPES